MARKSAVGPYINKPAAAPEITFGTDARRAEALEDGEYDATITSARHIVAKTGSVVVALNADIDGKPVRLQPLLIHSPGGDSDLTSHNRAVLADIADLGGQAASLSDLLKALVGKSCWLDLRLVTDRDKTDINRIVDGGPGDESADG